MRIDCPRAEESEQSKPQVRIGRYELLTEVARGPEAPLWIARVGEGADLGRLVMMRRIRRKSLDARSLEALRQAGTAATKIRDPRIVAVLDVVVVQEEFAVVSEYIDGELLRSVQRLAAQKGAPLPVPVSLRIGLDILTSIATASESVPSVGPARSVHGCISPDCVLVASFGDTMLTDLGVGGLGNGIDLRARPASTLAYSAPERFDRTSSLDERADVFSIGVLLWELISGKPLFGVTGAGADSETDALVQRIRSAPVARLESIRRAGSPVPVRVAEVIARALERDRDARFQSIGEMIRAIRRLDNMVATSDEVVTALDRIARPILEARRASLGQLTERLAARDSAPPESNRGTYRPPAPAPAAAIVPAIPPNAIPRELRASSPPRPRPPSALSTLGFPTPKKPIPARPSTGAPPPLPVKLPPPPQPRTRATPPPPRLQEPRGEAPPTTKLPPPTPPPADPESEATATPRLAPPLVEPMISAPPSPTPAPQVERVTSAREDDAKGPLAWAPDDGPRLASPAPDPLAASLSPERRRRMLHRVVPAILLGGAIVALVVTLGASRRSGTGATSSSPAAVSAAPAPDPQRAVESVPTRETSAPTAPPVADPAANAEPKREPAPVPAAPQRAGSGVASPRPGGDRAKPAGGPDGFRPHGI